MTCWNMNLANRIMKITKKPSMPKTENSNRKTLDEVLIEIRVIIDNTHWVQTRLTQLEAMGFVIEDCWVKNGRIETMWYMKRKKVLRIQVTDSELHGKYPKAKCVVIPISDISLKVGDVSRVRHLRDFK